MGLEIFQPWVTERGELAVTAHTNAALHQLRQLEDRAAPVGGDWKPFEVRLVRKDGGRSFKESDCPNFVSGFVVLRPAAVEVFGQFLRGDAEILDLLCADAELKLLNVWRHIDALDIANSDIVRFPSSGRIMTVRSYAFDDGAIDGHAMFRLSAMPRASIFVQRPIVEAAERAGLRLVSFRLVSKPAATLAQPAEPRRSVSMADIAAASDEELWEIIYRTLIPQVTGSRDEQYALVKSWSNGLQMLWATQLVDDEVNNGGFNQFFFNDSGQFAVEAIDGFDLIGAHERANVVRKAVEQLFKDAPRLRKFYEPRTMEAFMESYKHTDLGAMDEQWSMATEFFTARTRYIREHPEEFVITAVDRP
jgi:hypothetical protein